MTPNQQILPALDWFKTPQGGTRKRVFLIGSDYIFPRTANYIVKKYLHQGSMEVVGELYFPFEQRDFTEAFVAIGAAQADLILSTINGDSNIPFFQKYSELRIDPVATPIFATSIGENDLRAIPARFTSGHYAAWSFFQSMQTKEARQFIDRFQQEYGTDRPVHDPMESVYDQVFLWREAVELAGSLSADKVRKVLERGIEFKGPGGLVRIDPRNHHTYKRMRIGRIGADQQFEILYESPDWIRPDPFPAFAFPGWDCDWTKSGMQKGTAVDVNQASSATR